MFKIGMILKTIYDCLYIEKYYFMKIIKKEFCFVMTW